MFDIRNSQLPIAAVADDVCNALQHGNVVLQAQPGAGKSTLLPLALLNTVRHGKIVMLEPRRLAAQNVAARLAAQLGESIGQTIGLRMRGRTTVSKHTRIEVVTEGVLTRLLQQDPMLDGVAVIIFDEFHERSLHADLGLALCLDVQQGLRDDLRLLMMSATLDGDALCQHLQVEQPIVCEVRQHPVEIIWSASLRQTPERAVARTVTVALDEQPGDILAFLPGVAEIEKTARLLDGQLPADTRLYKFHGRAARDIQQAATARRGSNRRVILSTSIAETSLTIDGVRVVIDSGLERRVRIDQNSGAERLETVMASQASATQRAGRAGRTEAGVCYRLWAESGHERRDKQWQPEIYRADLSDLLLQITRWGVNNPHDLKWIDVPPSSSISRAQSLLQRLGLWHSEGLTENGRTAADLPVHPRFAAMLLWAQQHNAIETACQLIAVLEDRPAQKGSDLQPALQSSAHSHRVKQLTRLLGVDQSNPKLPSPSPAAILVQAFPDRIAKRREGDSGRYLLSSGSGASIHRNDPLAHSAWLIAAELGGNADEPRIFAALEISLPELEQWCSHSIQQRDVIAWHKRSERVIAESHRTIDAIVLDAKPLQNIDPHQRAIALLQGVQETGIECLDWTPEAREWQARAERLRQLAPELDLPAVDNESLTNSFEQWLLPWIGDSGTLKSLVKLNLVEMLKSMLSYEQQQHLDQWLPAKYTVPSGSQYKLQYACDGNPVLSVKLQEMFGCRENPAVANGRLPLKVALLSPAGRPVQITEDLANFWHNSYPQVKKEMAGRYPKHPWPEDPLNAQPTARTRKAMQKQ